MNLFRTYVSQGGGALIVLHDVALAAKFADRLIWMQDGQIIADGRVTDTLTEQRLADVYAIKAKIEGRRVEIINRLD